MRQKTLLVAVVSAVISIAGTCAGDDKLKQFMNLVAPETALKSPIVWTQAGKTTLAGLYWRNGKRDVSVLRYDGNNWNPVGTNGQAITGVGGNFLPDVALDADGTPWILTYYTRPSNSDRADRFFLYTLTDGKWTVAGPKSGHKADYSGGGSLFLLDQKRPTLFYRVWNSITKKYERRVYVLGMDSWKLSDFGSVIGTDSWVDFADSRIYVSRHNDGDWSIHELNSVNVETLPAPIHQFNIEAGLTVEGIFLKDRDTFILELYDKQASVSLRLFTKSRDRLVSHDIEPPDDHLIESMIRWTPSGDICVATNDLRTVRAYILQQDKTWKLVGKANEPSVATIFDPALAFAPDGEPIVTWEAFWRR